MKIIFMGTPEFSVPSLKKLHSLGHEISLVVTQQDRAKGRGKKVLFSPVKSAATDLGLNIFQPLSVNSEDSILRLKQEAADLFVVVAYGQLICPEVLNLPKKATINLHASLLPKYRGASPIHSAVMSGDKTIGVSVMEIQEELDAGDVIAQKSMELGEMDTEQAFLALSELGAELLSETISNFDTLYQERKAQNQEDATYTKKITKEMAWVNWSEDAHRIHNQVRALKPWPIASTLYKNQVLKIHRTSVVDMVSDAPYGKILQVSSKGILVATGKGGLQLEEIQMPNKRKMKVSEYLAGNTIELGVILGKGDDENV